MDKITSVAMHTFVDRLNKIIEEGSMLSVETKLMEKAKMGKEDKAAVEESKSVKDGAKHKEVRTYSINDWADSKINYYNSKYKAEAASDQVPIKESYDWNALKLLKKHYFGLNFIHPETKDVLMQ
jgi:hypothetical protein